MDKHLMMTFLAILGLGTAVGLLVYLITLPRF
jgi:hypothetical protein